MFLVLGAVTVVGPDGQVVALSDRQRSLLASLLARAGAVVSVDNLVDLVWPEDPLRIPWRRCTTRCLDCAGPFRSRGSRPWLPATGWPLIRTMWTVSGSTGWCGQTLPGH